LKDGLNEVLRAELGCEAARADRPQRKDGEIGDLLMQDRLPA
jgi:hypothetical protein